MKTCVSVSTYLFNPRSPYLKQKPVRLVVKDGAAALIFLHETRRRNGSDLVSAHNKPRRLQFLLVKEQFVT